MSIDKDPTLGDAIKAIEIAKLKIQSAQAALLVGMHRLALTPGSENPELNTITGELDSAHFRGVALSEVLSQYPEISNLSIGEIIPAGNQDQWPLANLLLTSSTSEEANTSGEPQIDDLHKYPRVQAFFENGELWRDNSGVRVIEYSTFYDLLPSFFEPKGGNSVDPKKLKQFVTNQLSNLRRRREFVRESHGHRSGFVREEDVQGLFVQWQALETSSRSNYQLSTAPVKNNLRVKKN